MFLTDDFLDQALWDKLVCGLQNETIQQKLSAEASLTLKCAFEIAQGMEVAHHQASELHASNSPCDIHAVSASKQP